MKYSKIEFWVSTGFFILTLLSVLYYGLSDYGYTIEKAHAKTDYIFYDLAPRLFVIVVTYGAFTMLNAYIIPKLWVQKKRLAAIGSILLLLITTGICYMVAQSYTSSWIYNQYGHYTANVTLFSRGFSTATLFLLIYGVYLLLRELIIYQYNIYKAKRDLASRVIREVILTFSAWLALFILAISINSREFFINLGAFYFIILPFCICIYFFNLYWIIPMYKKGVIKTVSLYVVVLAGIALTFGAIETALLMQSTIRFSLAGYLVITWLIPLLISTAVSWWVYVTNAKIYQQLFTLKTALGASDANLQFLRSQINPHFLFNILNTLYGTALSEKAEKTGEGIQKLGDMMRFMLHENMQEKIPLTRETEYLHNYIDLQNLRIALSDNIDIKTDITGQYNALQIAPMLLIPFIENAYKHGISLKHRSWINVSMQLQENVLQLDVYNSLHPEKDNDPERERSGIGLENVKQRLQLLYPQKHELVISQNPNEFFIHLTLQLS